MSDPLVIRVIRASRDRILAQETAQMADMARQWTRVEAELEAQMAALAHEIAAQQAAGEAVTQAQIYRSQRYRQLLADVKREIAKYNAYATGSITNGQATMAQEGINSASSAIRATYADANKVAAAFNTLPVQALENMFGLAGDGSPLTALLEEGFLDAAQGMTQALINAVATGKNPYDTARAMRDGLGAGFDRSLVIARTEQLRVYREASRMQYQDSGVVSGYRRVAAKQDRTCIACLLTDGRHYELDEPFEEHPNGRCTLVPEVNGVAAPEWQTGQDWFLTQSEATQQAMMGGAVYEAWQAGQFELDALVTRREDATWGAALAPTPLRELIQ